MVLQLAMGGKDLRHVSGMWDIDQWKNTHPWHAQLPYKYLSCVPTVSYSAGQPPNLKAGALKG